MQIAIIGGGAAGFFMAINLKLMNCKAEISIFEKKSKVLTKVAVSGGGRCNLSNSFASINELSKAYPRGDKLLKRAFQVFNHQDCYHWFESRGVPLVTQEDDCVFPRSQNSETIIQCFLQLAQELGISIKTSHTLTAISKDEKYILSFKEGGIKDQAFDILAVTTGGNSKEEEYSYLKDLGHKIIKPIPSLFTFNIPDDPIRDLMGVVVQQLSVSIENTKIKASGALLITHWGMSGPVILKLSSYAAKVLNEKNYQFCIHLNWLNETNCERIGEQLQELMINNSGKQLANIRPYNISSRLWLFLLRKAGIPQERKWGELGSKGINKLVNILSHDQYKVEGKGKFRDEFVSCGGVSLDSINMNTMESKTSKNLYFAGEVLDIDGITGGFNLQAAWTTAYVAAQAICKGER